MATATGLQIRQELERYGLIKLLGRATATGSTSYLTDATRLKGTSLPGTRFDGCDIRATALGGTPWGQVRRIDYLDADNGYLYVTPVWSVAPTHYVTYEIWRQGIDSDEVDRARDEALVRDCAQWDLHPLSEVTNAAYVEGTVGSAPTDWTATGGSSTAVKATLAFPVEYSRNVMTVDCVDSAAAYAASASIYVQPGQTFFLHVPVSVQSGTAEVTVRRITSTAADITLTGTSTATGRGWTGINVTGTIPTGCYEIQVWLGGTGAADVAQYGPVYFHWTGQKRINLPARVTSRDHVGPVGFIHDQMGANSTTYWGEERLREIPRQVEQISDNVIVRLDQGMENRPYFYIERAFFSALQAATVTGTGIAFVDGAGAADTITDSASGLAVFAADDSITITGSADNDGTYTVVSAVAGTITLVTAILTAEGAGANVTITRAPAYLTAANRATGDAATTLANREYVAAATALRLAARYKEMDPPFWSDVEAKAGPIFAAKEREFGPRAFVRADRDEGYEIFSERVGTFPQPTHAPNPPATEGQ